MRLGQRKKYVIPPHVLTADERKAQEESTRRFALFLMGRVQISASKAATFVEGVRFFLGHRNTQETNDHFMLLHRALMQLAREKHPIPSPEVTDAM